MPLPRKKMISSGTKWWMANSGSHMGCVWVSKGKGANRRQGLAGEIGERVCLCECVDIGLICTCRGSRWQ